MAAFRDSISAWVIHTLLVDCGLEKGEAVRKRKNSTYSYRSGLMWLMLGESADHFITFTLRPEVVFDQL